VNWPQVHCLERRKRILVGLASDRRFERLRHSVERKRSPADRLASSRNGKNGHMGDAKQRRREPSPSGKSDRLPDFIFVRDKAPEAAGGDIPKGDDARVERWRR
jgi:hypothetical protein